MTCEKSVTWDLRKLFFFPPPVKIKLFFKNPLNLGKSSWSVLPLAWGLDEIGASFCFCMLDMKLQLATVLDWKYLLYVHLSWLG